MQSGAVCQDRKHVGCRLFAPSSLPGHVMVHHAMRKLRHRHRHGNRLNQCAPSPLPHAQNSKFRTEGELNKKLAERASKLVLLYLHNIRGADSEGGLQRRVISCNLHPTMASQGQKIELCKCGGSSRRRGRRESSSSSSILVLHFRLGQNYNINRRRTGWPAFFHVFSFLFFHRGSHLGRGSDLRAGQEEDHGG